jgi:hypothetical protein
LRNKRIRALLIYAALVVFVLGYAALWFFFNVGRMPPYIPGATTDPTFASPRAVANLALFASVLILPGSALACFLAFRIRAWARRRMSHAGSSH